MADVSSSSSSTTTEYTEQDTTIETIEEYFGETVTLEDLADMSDEERIAYFEELYATGKVSEEDIEEFKSALQDELDNYYSELYTYNKELQAMLDSGNLTVAEEANIELIMQDLQEWMDLCDSTIGTDWGNAVEDFNSLNITVADGDSETVDTSGASEGDVYNITCDNGSAESTDGSYFNSDENANWLDLDGDGYKETNPDAYDPNDLDGDGITSEADGIADEDYDGDGVITEADLTYGSNTESPTTVELPDDGTSYYVQSYDASTDTVSIKATKEDGTVFYINITGAEKIIMPPPTNYESLDPTLLAKMYESESAVDSFYFHVYGEEYADSTTESHYSVYDLSNDTLLNAATIEPSEDDFANGRAYTINFDSSTADSVDFTFPADATITYSTDAAGNIVMTVECSQGTITITLVGYEDTSNSESTTPDTVTINGTTITSEEMVGTANAETPSETEEPEDSEEEGDYDDETGMD